MGNIDPVYPLLTAIKDTLICCIPGHSICGVTIRQQTNAVKHFPNSPGHRIVLRLHRIALLIRVRIYMDNQHTIIIVLHRQVHALCQQAIR